MWAKNYHFTFRLNPFQIRALVGTVSATVSQTKKRKVLIPFKSGLWLEHYGEYENEN